MKKVYKILAITAALMWGFGLQSCNNEVEEVSPRYPILFDCEGDTRAVANLATMQGDENGFGVFAHYEFPENYGGKEFNFKKQVTYDSSKPAWTYNGLEYWLAGATYNFVAVYPYSIAQQFSRADGVTYLTYQFKDGYTYNVADQLDIMVAKASAEVPEDAEFGPIPYTGSAVNLAFDHILSNIIVKVKAEVGVTINTISLGTILTSGKCFITSGGTSWNTTGTTTIEKEPKLTLAIGSDYTDITDGGFLVIPEDIRGSAKLKLETSVKNYEVTIPSIDWEAGKQYTYTMTIKQNDIVFNEPSVVEWDEENATGSVIIK